MTSTILRPTKRTKRPKPAARKKAANVKSVRARKAKAVKAANVNAAVAAVVARAANGTTVRKMALNLLVAKLTRPKRLPTKPKLPRMHLPMRPSRRRGVVVAADAGVSAALLMQPKLLRKLHVNLKPLHQRQW